MATIIARARAYERKAELGGGFRAVGMVMATKERLDAGVHPTLAGARHAAKRAVFDKIGPDVWSQTRPGYSYGKSSWACNYWG